MFLTVLVMITILLCTANLFHKWNDKILWVLNIAALVIAGIRILLYGIRLTLLPLYLLEVLSISLFITGIMLFKKNKRTKKTTSVLTIAVYIILAVLTVISIFLFPQFQLPGLTGNYLIGEKSLQLNDYTREELYTKDKEDYRKIMISVWYPIAKYNTYPKEHYPNEVGDALNSVLGMPKSMFSYFKYIKTDISASAPIAKAKYPLIIFSPGNNSTRFQNMSLVEELVSNGYVVIGIDHPYTSNDIVFADGSVSYRAYGQIDLLNADNVYQAEVEIRAKDLEFVLDQLKNHQQELTEIEDILPEIDFDSIGLIGHSYGGATIAEVMAQDDSIKAGISFDGGLWGDAAKYGVKHPFLYMSASKTLDYMYSDKDSDMNKKEFVTEVLQNLHKMQGLSEDNVCYSVFQDYNHYSFTDIPMICSLFGSGDDQLKNTISISKTFMNQYLKNQDVNFKEDISNLGNAKITKVSDILSGI